MVIDDYKGDPSTDKGRKAIKAFCRLITKTKNYIDGHRKELTSEYKDIPKKIDANGKKEIEQVADSKAGDLDTAATLFANRFVCVGSPMSDRAPPAS